MQPWDHLQPVDRIRENYSTFKALVSVAVDNTRDQKYETAAVATQLAADFAWCNHPGVFSSSLLEKTLLDIRASLKLPPSRPRNRSQVESILHVMTQAYSVGGHTRLVANWIEKDSTRKHSLVLTRQRQLALPEFLNEIVSKAQGNVYLLDEKRGGLLNRAKHLNELAANFDLIVLHIHPYDVVPTIALAHDTSLPPIIFLQHADIVFYLGTSVGDVVAHVRDESVEVSHNRRGIDPARSFVMPIPLQLKSRLQSQHEAKSQLGVDPFRTVLLTVASEYKFADPGGVTYADAILPVLQKHPDAELFVVGPRESPEWSRAAELVDGRIHVMGVVDDPSSYYEAADVYLNSFPVGALTSLLEAGSYGIPLISYQSFSPEHTLLRCSDPALTDTLRIETDIDQYRQTISELITDYSKRETLGQQTKEAIADLHTGGGWQRKLEELYQRASAAGKLVELVSIESEQAMSEVDKGVFWMNNSLVTADQGTEHSRLLSVRKRFKTWNKLGRKEWRLLLPESIGTHNERLVEQLWRSLKGKRSGRF